MKSGIATLLGAALLASAVAVHAQTPPGDAGKGQHRQEMREKMKAAYEACKDKPDRRACMIEQRCAKAPDPAQCRERAKERGAKMQ